MPVKVVKRGEKYRLIDSDTGRIAKNKAGTAIDGGGKKSRSAVARQASAVNTSLSKRGKI